MPLAQSQKDQLTQQSNALASTITSLVVDPNPDPRDVKLATLNTAVGNVQTARLALDAAVDALIQANNT